MRSEAENRFRLAKSLYFYLMDHILRAEIKNKPHFVNKISLELFNVTLLACCLELVLEAYNTELKFPWILDCFSINAFEFSKIIEIVVRHGSHEGGCLTRSLVKHLNSIEETCLERLAWQSTSPVWDLISKASKPLPTFTEVHNAKGAGPMQIFLRKVYLLGWLRISKLCTELNLCEKKPHKIWTIFEHSITHKIHLLQDRHLDQIIMCAIYIYIRVSLAFHTYTYIQHKCYVVIFLLSRLLKCPSPNLATLCVPIAISRRRLIVSIEKCWLSRMASANSKILYTSTIIHTCRRCRAWSA